MNIRTFLTYPGNVNCYYEYSHVVGFEETNLVGNVYYVNYLRWQGQCREMFLLEHAPQALDELRGSLRLFVMESDCEFFGEIAAFDKLSIRMQVNDLTQTQIGFSFEYFKDGANPEILIARGSQRVACLTEQSGRTTPTRIPDYLQAALEDYRPLPPNSRRLVSNVGGRA